MKKCLLGLLGVMVAGVASAITIAWEWTSNGSDWQSSSSIYMVYSQSSLTADQVAATATNGSYGNKPGALDSKGQAWTSGSVSAVSGAVVGKSGTPTSGKNAYVSFSQSGGEPPGNFDWNNAGNGYYYLVIFNNTIASDATKFAVAQAGVSGQLDIDFDKGTVVSPGPDGGLHPIEYIDPTWIGGMYRSPAPEPTALALLALGVAGVALRRRVR